jgi:hypothetical protein
MRKILPLFLITLSCPQVSDAESTVMYESLSGITIGRVFLSQRERDILDARRLANPHAVTAVEGTPTADARRGPPTSAGYIIGRHGRSKIWKDGDFVESKTDPESSVAFPGDVEIKRNAVNDAPASEEYTDDGAKERRRAGGDG